jgi:vacuolar protein sorting-associated protein 45
MLLDLLSVSANVPASKLDVIAKLMTYHQSLQKLPVAGGIPELFQPGSFFSAARDRFTSLKGVENVYTQHTPMLEGTLQDLIKGKLKEQLYPFVEGGGTTKDKPQDIIIFMIGGTTYEEAKMVAQVNASSPGVRVVLAGTKVHNSSTFLEEVEDAAGSWPAAGPATAAGRLRKEVGRA